MTRTENLMMAAALALALSGGMAAAKPTAAMLAAVADKARPEADTKRDADRKPAEIVAFAGVKPGDKVAEMMPGGGYFTRIFSKVVGPRGHVYAYVPDELTKLAKRPPSVNAIAAGPSHGSMRQA